MPPRAITRHSSRNLASTASFGARRLFCRVCESSTPLGVASTALSAAADLPSPTHIRRHFGSLPEAMRQAGLPILSHSQRQLEVWQRRRAAGVDQYYLGARWTDAELLRAMKRLHRRYGYISNTLLDRNLLSRRSAITPPPAISYVFRISSRAPRNIGRVRELCTRPPLPLGGFRPSDLLRWLGLYGGEATFSTIGFAAAHTLRQVT
jgi:hypothetical protein